MTTQPQPPLRVLIADDHHLFAEALGLTLSADERLEVVGYARDGKEAVRLAAERRADVVVMDLEMPVMDGIDATREIRRDLPNCHVAVVTASAAPVDALRARDAGAGAYLTKGCSARDVVEALGKAHGHQLHELFSPEEWLLAQQRYQDLLTGRDTRFQVRFLLRRADGDSVWVRLSASVLNAAGLSGAPQPLHLVTTVDDITELELLQQQLRHQSLHDPETGLPNRHYLLTHLEQVMAQGESSAMVTMMHLDLDGFSAIHDGLGCHAGEQLLDAVARRLERVVGSGAAPAARDTSDIIQASD